MKIVSVGTTVAWGTAWSVEPRLAWGTAFLGHGVVRGDALCLGITCGMVFVLPWSFLVVCLLPNATRQALEIAGAKHERRLCPVACTRLFGGV